MKHFLVSFKDDPFSGYVVKAENIEGALALGKKRWIEQLGHDCLVVAEELTGFYDNMGIKEQNKKKGE